VEEPFLSLCQKIKAQVEDSMSEWQDTDSLWDEDEWRWLSRFCPGAYADLFNMLHHAPTGQPLKYFQID
jgi:hypothetical protein